MHFSFPHHKVKCDKDEVNFFFLSFSAHTGIRGNETDQLTKETADQLTKGKRSNPHHICPTEKSKLLSIIRRKPSSTARLEDTTQTSKPGSRYGPLVCPSKPSSGGLQRICSWHPSMRHSLERGSSQRNHHIERRRRRWGQQHEGSTTTTKVDHNWGSNPKWPPFKFCLQA